MLKKKKLMAMNNGVLRVLVSIIAIPVILAASYFGGYYFLFFVLVISLISFYEFALLVRNKNMHVNMLMGLLCVFFFVVNSYLKLLDNYTSLLIVIAALCAMELFRNKSSALLNLGAAFLGILYIGLFSSTLVLIREFYILPGENYLNGGLLIISIFVSIWICDSAAYYIGSAFGKHKLFPRVSPKKSWEGTIAGFVFTLLAMIASKLLVLDFLSWNSAIGIGIIVGVFGQIGDLIESLFKRESGVKDSSALIPGHGGIFDRFDSLIFSAPLIFILLKLMER
jgi:phosphatidate cytidylyltransferase